MALFDKTYKDTIRLLKKEKSIEQKREENTHNNILPFNLYIYDISDIQLEPFSLPVFYKKNNVKYKHSYKFTRDNDINYNIRRKNVFADVKVMLEHVLSNDINDRPIVNNDFLTGYYMGKTGLLGNHNVNSILHLGLSKDGFLRGFYYTLNKKTKLNIYGVDNNVIDIYKKNYVNGIKKPCDVYDINSIRSINIQLSETIKSGDITLFIGDIKTNSSIDVLKQFLIAVEWVSNNATIVLRLPLNIDKCFTSINTILQLFISRYNSVKLFKTPWSIIPKIYVILTSPKKNISRAEILNIISYINDMSKLPESDIGFINSIVYDDNEEAFQLLIQNISDNYIKCIEYDVIYSSSEVVELFNLLNEPSKLN